MLRALGPEGVVLEAEEVEEDEPGADIVGTGQDAWWSFVMGRAPASSVGNNFAKVFFCFWLPVGLGGAKFPGLLVKPNLRV